MSIYTKTGDTGETSLGNGRRVLKCDKIIEALGVIDELNAVIGVIKSQNSKLKAQNYNVKLKSLNQIQKDLFLIGVLVCKAKSGEQEIKIAKKLKNHVRTLEKEIDAMSAKLTPLNHFILPGGSDIGACVHMARAVCRRAERRVVALQEILSIYGGGTVLIYMNRLSDFLFVLARWANHQRGVPDVLWRQ